MAQWIRYWAAKTEACTASKRVVRILLDNFLLHVISRPLVQCNRTQIGPINQVSSRLKLSTSNIPR